MTDLLFEKFPKISRLKRDCIITEKIDGTNAQILIGIGGTSILTGSRNRWVTPQNDNYGFARWVEENKEELLLLGPGRHFGEWWGAGIQRRYGLEEKRFSLFNTSRHKKYLPSCVSLVPELYRGPFSDGVVDMCLSRLRNEGSVAAPGFMKPEGVVVFLPAGNHLFKVTLDGDGHKGVNT